MAKKIEKLLFITALLSVLMISSIYSVLTPNVHATEVTNQQKTLSIMGNVVGLNLTKYDVTTTETSVAAQASYLGVVPQENVAAELTSDGSKLKAIYTFADGNLQMIHVLERDGTPSLSKPASTNDVKLAQDFLGNYQSYTDNPLFGQLKTTLKYVVAGKNITKTSENTVLEAIAKDGYTTFKWYYSENGAVAPYSKFISLSFKDGFLWMFVDNWQFYSVGSTTVNLSEKEAVAIALEAAKAHSWAVKLEAGALDAENFNESNVRWASLVFDNSLDASKTRSEDPLELYPVWRVGIALNKWYGQMYGIQVDIWADTGEVRSVQEAWSTMPPPADAPIAYADSQAADSEAKPSSAMLIAIPSFAAVATATILWMSRKKKGHCYSLLRPRVVKAGGILLCVLIASLVFLASVETVNATTRAGVVWGSESTGAYGFGLPYTNFTWRKSQDEIYWQKNAAGNISEWFDDNGYTGINHQGNLGSYRTQILTDMWNISNYDYSAIVDFDHGVGGYPGQIQGYPIPDVPPDEFHYMFEDNEGAKTGPYLPSTYPPRENHPENAIYDMDLYFTLPAGGVKFAFMSFCKSACIANQGMLPGFYPWWISRPVGMPLSCTGRFVADIDTTPGFNITYYISDDGYDDPDMGSQVYIGFPDGSASLSQPVPYTYGADPYAYWVYYFFYWALYDDISVNQALDEASNEVYGVSFGDCPLRTGFTAKWWTPPGADPMEQDDCTMAVYGNGNIHLKNYVPPSHSVAVRFLSGPSLGDLDTSYQFSASAADSEDHEVRYLFDWGDGTQNVTDYYPSYATVNAAHSWSSADEYSVKVKAQCENGVWSDWSSTHVITIGYHMLTVLACDQYERYGYVPLEIDYQYVGTTGYAYPVSEDSHWIGVESPLYGYDQGHYYEATFQYYYYDSTYNYNNPMNLAVMADKTITAHYYIEMLW